MSIVADQKTPSIQENLPKRECRLLTSQIGDCEVIDHNVLPLNFERPSIVERFDGVIARGISDASSPWSAVLSPA